MNEDKIIHMLLDHEDRLERIEKNMATKQDLHEISSTLDTLVQLAEKNDQERTMMGEGIKRMRKDVDRMKPLVGLV